MKKSYLIPLILLIVSGCAFFKSSDQMTKSAEELASEGSAAFLGRDYKTSLKAFTALRDWYPFSRYAILAELKIADSHFYLKQYDEAILAYEEFEKLHPRNEAIPYVIYQTGLSWFNQIRSVDRDHTQAGKSLEQFRRLTGQFPSSEYAAKADDYIDKCIQALAGHELYVANFYMRTKKYKAALARYQEIVEKYPGTPEGREAEKKIPQAREQAGIK